jgi:hypothetical protein
LKLASLLVQFLYAHKRLDLPGIGSFLLNDQFSSEPGDHKHDKQAGMEHISFESNPTVKQSPDLVQFIAEQSGKIRALASADLESHLTLAKQFLNIGNPFLFEGIGTLEKKKSGEYLLIPAMGLPEKTKEFQAPEKTGITDEDKFNNDYKKIFYSGKAKINWKKPFVFGLIITGLVLAIWGGYIVYKKTTAKNRSDSGDQKTKKSTVPAEATKDTGMFQKDSVMHQKDSVVDTNQQSIPPPPVKQQLSPPPSGSFRFVLEDAKAKRAFERFAKLKTFQWPVQMATKDSVFYTLFVVLPSSAADTSRIIDSLSRLNGRRVYIGQ